MASKALWQLEEERWELAEKVLEVPATDIQVPQQWRAQWNSAASSVPEVRSYDLTFGPGGRLEGLSDGSNGAFRVDGAFDVEEGTIRWREVSLSYGTVAPSVVECYGQWDPRSGRIDGFFSAFDVSTLPQQIGQGHFALTSRAAKDAAHPPLLPPVPPPSSAMSSARHAHDFEAAESDMVWLAKPKKLCMFLRVYQVQQNQTVRWRAMKGKSWNMLKPASCTFWNQSHGSKHSCSTWDGLGCTMKICEKLWCVFLPRCLCFFSGNRFMITAQICLNLPLKLELRDL